MKDKYRLAFIDMAERFGQTSEATRLKVGALIVKIDQIIAQGCNGMPPGWPTEVCEEDGATKPECRHAEVAALEKLWASSESATGADMYISHSPCKPCAIKIATAKIGAVYYKHNYRDESGVQYLRSRGIDVYQITGENIERVE